MGKRSRIERRQREETGVFEPEKGEKGYVSLDIHQFGSLNLELHCDLAPRTCENFLYLCEKGFYDGVKFHRNVPNFMIQGVTQPEPVKKVSLYTVKPLKTNLVYKKAF